MRVFQAAVAGLPYFYGVRLNAVTRQSDRAPAGGTVDFFFHPEPFATLLNIRSKKFRHSSETSRPAVRFLVSVTNERRRHMRKLSYVLAALATIAVAAPTIASAQGFSVRIGGDRDYYRDRDYYGPRAGFYGHDRGWHRGWYHRYGDRDVIVRRHHYWD